MTAQPLPPARQRSRRSHPPNFDVINPAYVDQLSAYQGRLIADVLRRGGVVWFMSDCAYALGVDPRHPRGVAALDALLDHSGAPIPLTAGNETIAASVVKYDEKVRAVTGKFWPGGLGLWTRANTRLGRALAKRLRGGGGVVVRVSQSVVESQISAAVGLPITSAALRSGALLVIDAETALDLAIRLHEERTPGLRTIFIRDLRRRTPLADHSTMVKLDRGHLSILRTGSIDPDEVRKVALSNHGVDWGDAT